MTKRDPVAEALDMAKAIIRRHLPGAAHKLFLFGSRASGGAHARSDIDIGIEGPEPVPYETLADIIEELEESPTLYSIDLVDFRCVPEEFRQVAQARQPL